MLPAIDFFESEDSLSHKYSGVGTPASLGKWMNKPVDLIYFDCCQVGNEMEWFRKYFNAKCAVGYKIDVDSGDSNAISNVFFRDFDEKDKDSGEYSTIKKTIEDIYKKTFNGTPYNPTDISSDCPIRIINPEFGFKDFLIKENFYE